MNTLHFFVSLLLIVAPAYIAAKPSAVPVDCEPSALGCKCLMAVDTKTDQGAEPGLAIPGCGTCLAVFTEMVDVTKGQCTGNGCSTKGACKGKLKVTITSVASDCCAGLAGGFSPSWGSGWFAPGSDTDHTFDEDEVKCAEFAETRWNIKWRNANLAVTTQDIISKVTCSNCNAD